MHFLKRGKKHVCLGFHLMPLDLVSKLTVKKTKTNVHYILSFLSYSVYFLLFVFFLPATIHIDSNVPLSTLSHLLLVNYEVMLCALITCLSEDPRIYIALPRCTKTYVVCNVNSNGNLFCKCNQPYLFFLEKSHFHFCCMLIPWCCVQRLPVVIWTTPWDGLFYCLFVYLLYYVYCCIKKNAIGSEFCGNWSPDYFILSLWDFFSFHLLF